MQDGTLVKMGDKLVFTSMMETRPVKIFLVLRQRGYTTKQLRDTTLEHFISKAKVKTYLC